MAAPIASSSVSGRSPPRKALDDAVGASSYSYAEPHVYRSFQGSPASHGPSRMDFLGVNPRYQRPGGGRVENVARATELGISVTSMLAQTIFSHPFVVMRRQCQLNPRSSKYHLTPFTVFQVMMNVQKHQSLGTYWKGLSSKFLAEGVQIVAERVIGEATPLPRELNRHTSIRRLGQHLALKGLGFAIATPFIASSFVDSVRSEIASEGATLLECAQMAVTRVISWSATETARMLPIWKIIVPVVVHGLLHYSIWSLARYSVSLTARTESAAKDDEDKPVLQLLYDSYFPDLVGCFAGSLLADITLYPLETVVHRLLVQGTRSIVDNTDTGLGVLPVNTHYSGFFNCLSSILTQEGTSGLYKGFGALVIQYAIHALILRASHLLYRRIVEEWTPPLAAAAPLVTAGGDSVAAAVVYPSSSSSLTATAFSSSSGSSMSSSGRQRQYTEEQSLGRV